MSAHDSTCCLYPLAIPRRVGDTFAFKPRPAPPLVSAATPFAHQSEAVEFLLKNRRCILADDMGVGKTLSAILAARGRTIVLCKSSLKANWLREIKTAFPGTDRANHWR